MKRLILAFLALSLVASLSSCNNAPADSKATNDSTAASTTDVKKETESTTVPVTTAAPETTVAKTEPATEANPPEVLVNYDSIKSTKTDVTSLVDINSLEWDVDGFSDTESALSLFDGDTGTKYCCPEPPTISFKLSESKKVTAYAFATANDNEQYGRSADEFILYGSADGKDWKVLDYVQRGFQVIEELNFTYYAFLVDADKQGDYQYYKFQVIEADAGDTFQASEFQLFTD